MHVKLLVLALSISASILATGYGAASPHRRTQVTNPCQIDGEGIDSAALYRVRSVLTDTGEVGEMFADVRAGLGIVGVHMKDVVTVGDTTTCRRVLTAWKEYYRAIGSDESVKAASVKGGLLLKLSPNRYTLAVAVFQPYTVATFFVTDSDFSMIRPSM